MLFCRGLGVKACLERRAVSAEDMEALEHGLLDHEEVIPKTSVESNDENVSETVQVRP
jgi:hypothetical protein